MDGARIACAFDDVPDDLTVQQRLNLAWARLIVLTEQGEFGSAFDDTVADIAAARIPASNNNMLGIWYTVTFGRLAQAAAATGAERDRRLAQARTGMRTLWRGRRMLREMILDCCDVETDARGGVIDYQRTERSGRYCQDAAAGEGDQGLFVGLALGAFPVVEGSR